MRGILGVPFRLSGRLLLATSLLPILGPSPAGAQALADQFHGRWTTEGGSCAPGFTLDLSGDELRWTDAAGQVDRQQVVSRRPDGIATKTVQSSHGQPKGKAWVYEVLAPGQIALTEGSTGHSATLLRCPDPVPANATPQQILGVIYARYAADDEPNLPFASEANVREFFVPSLADAMVGFVAHSGRVPNDCRPEDPFMPGPFGAGVVSQVAVEVPAGAAADHAEGHVSFRNNDMPTSVTVTFDRTPDGWRIADVVPQGGRSFRAMLAACNAPVAQQGGPAKP